MLPGKDLYVYDKVHESLLPTLARGVAGSPLPLRNSELGLCRVHGKSPVPSLYILL